MHNLRISQAVLDKLDQKHGVSRREVEQGFENKCGLYLEDDREDHKSDPPTLWFVAPTSQGRLLKIIFIYRDGLVHLRSAFDADAAVQHLYDQKAR
jgi:uncharacterized DUF497 family protein